LVKLLGKRAILGDTAINLKQIFGLEKPIIGMVHIWAPSPSYRQTWNSQTLQEVFSQVEWDIRALQEGGVDGLLFVNESDKPSRDKVSQDVYAWLSLIVGGVFKTIKIPFGLEVLADKTAGIQLGLMYGASFVRGNFFDGAITEDFEVRSGSFSGYRSSCELEGEKLAIFGNYSISNSGASPMQQSQSLEEREIPNYISGILISEKDLIGSLEYFLELKLKSPKSQLIVSSGIHIGNAKRISGLADGIIVGSYFKEDGIITNRVDPKRVLQFVSEVRT